MESVNSFPQLCEEFSENPRATTRPALMNRISAGQDFRLRESEESGEYVWRWCDCAVRNADVSDQKELWLPWFPSQIVSYGERGHVKVVRCNNESSNINSNPRFHEVFVIVRQIHNGTAVPNQRSVRISEFLDTIYLLSQEEDKRPAVDLIINQIDDFLVEGGFDECDTAMRRANLLRFADAPIVSFLAITHAAKTHLPSRAGFYLRALDVMGSRRGEGNALRLLKKYQ